MEQMVGRVGNVAVATASGQPDTTRDTAHMRGGISRSTCPRQRVSSGDFRYEADARLAKLSSPAAEFRTNNGFLLIRLR